MTREEKSFCCFWLWRRWSCNVRYGDGRAPEAEQRNTFAWAPTYKIQLAVHSYKGTRYSSLVAMWAVVAVNGYLLREGRGTGQPLPESEISNFWGSVNRPAARPILWPSWRLWFQNSCVFCLINMENVLIWTLSRFCWTFTMKRR